MSIINEVRHYKTYCEPYGRRFDTGIEIVKSGYCGDICYNTTHKEYMDFWRILQENPSKLAKEISFMNQLLNDRETMEDKNKLIVKKLNERKAIQRAAAQYMIFFGLEDGMVEHLQSLKDDTYTIKWYNLTTEEFIREKDSYDTFFYIVPSIQEDIFDSEFIKLLQEIKGRWVMDYFYDKRIKDAYNMFNVGYIYNQLSINTLNIRITNDL